MAHILIGAGIGAAGSLATGGDPMKGALLGGITGGAVGGAEGGILSSAGSSTVSTATPTIGGHLASGATTGAVGGATAGGVAGATASPYAFGNNALEVASGSTMPLTATGTASVDPTGFDKLVDKVTPAGGYDENSLLDKISKNTGFADMTPLEKVQTGLFASEAFTPQEQAQAIMQGGGGQINPGKPVDVGGSGTGILNVEVPTGVIDDVRKRQLFYR